MGLYLTRPHIHDPILNIALAFTFMNLRSIGPFTLAKTKIKKNWFLLLYRFTLPEKPITFGFFGTKSACAKKPESHTGVLVSGAHARLLSTFDRTCLVRITSRAAVG